MTMVSSSLSSKPHIVLFPFMAKGHTIPLLHLARLLLERDVFVTFFTTPRNRPFISQSLSGSSISIIELPFPDIPGIPHGSESTDKLPSMSLFIPFANGIKQIQPFFDEALAKIHQEITCIISDGFLPWTLQSASKFGIPRVCFYGMSNYALALSRDAKTSGLLSLHESPDEPFTLPSFPNITLTRNHFNAPFDKRDPRGPYFDFIVEATIATANSFGLVVNSFYELEKPFTDYFKIWNSKLWCVGPFCLAEQPKPENLQSEMPEWMLWLEKMSTEGRPILYVAFGSQANLSSPQLQEIALGLEESKVNFFWVFKKSSNEKSFDDGFEDRVKERGIIVKEWVDQRAILEHEIVQGFVSHCGWNSVLEGICAEVPIVAWPMMAEQFLNAKMVEEEIKVGVRVNTVDESPKGFVTKESLKNTIVDVMEGEKGKELRAKVKEVAAEARKAMAEGGSSWNDLNNLINETQGIKEINTSKLQ